MTTSLLAATPVEQDFALREEHEESAISDGGRLTLGQLVDSVWEGLHAAGAAGCPACGGRMERARGAGHCRGCGGTLA
jgi:hypothetical protein